MRELLSRVCMTPFAWRTDRGYQPVIYVCAQTLAEAFHKTLGAVWEHGCEIATSFDRLGELPSRDATVLVEIADPFLEPRFSKVGWPGGPYELEIYRLEVLYGVHDHWIDRGSIEWGYTYHERLFAFDIGDGKKVNQIENMIQQMTEAPDLFRRRFQVTTWMPHIDPLIADPPCLQRLHFRWLPGENGVWVLNVNSDWRSRDLSEAWFMNVVAISDIQRLVAQEVAQRRGIKVRIGRYSDKSDSLHIYGRRFYAGEGGHPGVKERLERIKRTPAQDLSFSRSDLEPMFQEARHLLAAQLESEKRGAGRGVLSEELKSKWQEFPYPQEWDF